MSDKPTLELLDYRLTELEKDKENLEKKIAQLEEVERKKLLWGISALGSVVLALGGIIWTYRGVIFK